MVDINIKRDALDFVGDLGTPGMNDEFKKANIKTEMGLLVFYTNTKYYLIECADHPHMPEFKDLSVNPGSRILDFGGGAGSDSIPLAIKGFEVDYIDINIHQKEFVKMMIEKYGLSINIVDKPKGKYEIVIMRDVVEHLYDYRPYVKMCIEHLLVNGYFVCIPTFKINDVKTEFSLHFHDKHNFPEFLKKLGLVKINDFVWRLENG